MIAVGVLWRAEGLFRNRVVRGASFFLGRVSYWSISSTLSSSWR